MKCNDIFVWNLYRVFITNHEGIFVCAPSFIGAIKRANILIRSWDDSEKYSIECVKYVGTCLN